MEDQNSHLQFSGSEYGENDENIIKECYYCGNYKTECLIKCINSKCNRYFCNSPLNDEYRTSSHIYQHMDHRKHFEVALGDDEKLMCHICENMNCLTLNYHFDGNDIEIICRTKCLVEFPNLRNKEAFWTPVVTEQTFDQYFASREIGGTLLDEKQIYELELNLSLGLIKNPFEVGPSNVKQIKMKYETLTEYQETFQLLIDLEHEYELKYDRGEYQKEMMPQWSDDYSSFSFWIVDEQCHFRPKDEVCVIATGFNSNAVIQSIERNGEIFVTLKGNKVGNRNINKVTIKNTNTDVAYNRMTRGLKMMKKIDENIRNLLLGFNIEMPNKGLHPLHDYSVKGLSKLNPSQNEAVKNALNSMFCLIQGPPGTGKTVTTASIVYHLSKIINRQSVYKSTEAEKKSREEELCNIFDTTCAIQQEIEFKTQVLNNFAELQSKKPNFEQLRSTFLQHIDRHKAEIKKFDQKREALFNSINILSRKFESLEDDSERKRVLVAAPSNVAVDHLVKKIVATGLKVVRFYSKSKEEVKSELSRFSYHQIFLNELKLPENQKINQLFYLKKSNGLDKASNSAYGYLEKELRDKILKDVDVVCCTCIGALDNRLTGLRFSKVIIDEACQSREPESLLPLLYRPDQIILVGDNYQLGPIIKCKITESAGLMNSLFQRMVDLDRPTYMLNIQYRMHPCISEFPSKKFYGGYLENGISAQDRIDHRTKFRWPGEEPVFFYHIDSQEEHSSTGVSFVNRLEAQKVVEIVNQIGLGADIGVITFYDAQRVTIMNYLRDKSGPNIEIASVDSFQGREKDYIILSCVRSNLNSGVGFLGNYRRLNVAITRAKYGMIICGNANTLCKSRIWSSLLKHYQKKELIFYHNGIKFEKYRDLNIKEKNTETYSTMFGYLDFNPNSS